MCQITKSVIPSDSRCTLQSMAAFRLWTERCELFSPPPPHSPLHVSSALRLNCNSGFCNLQSRIGDEGRSVGRSVGRWGYKTRSGAAAVILLHVGIEMIEIRGWERLRVLSPKVCMYKHFEGWEILIPRASGNINLAVSLKHSAEAERHQSVALFHFPRLSSPLCLWQSIPAVSLHISRLPTQSVLSYMYRVTTLFLN